MDRMLVVEILIKYQRAVEEAVMKSAFAEAEWLSMKHRIETGDVVLNLTTRYEISQVLVHYMLEDEGVGEPLVEIELLCGSYPDRILMHVETDLARDWYTVRVKRLGRR